MDYRKKMDVEGFENAEAFVNCEDDKEIVLSFSVDDGYCAAGFEFSRIFKTAKAAEKFFDGIKEKMTEAQFNTLLDNGFEEC
jgi:hypothetical protein